MARSLRDDFRVYVEAVKVALTVDQVKEFRLPPKIKAKQTSSNYRKFAKKYGDNVFELEALSPEDLQQVLRDAIDAVLDIEAFNREIDQEKEDAAELETTRKMISEVFRELDSDGEAPTL